MEYFVKCIICKDWKHWCNNYKMHQRWNTAVVFWFIPKYMIVLGKIITCVLFAKMSLHLNKQNRFFRIFYFDAPHLFKTNWAKMVLLFASNVVEKTMRTKSCLLYLSFQIIKSANDKLLFEDICVTKVRVKICKCRDAQKQTLFQLKIANAWQRGGLPKTQRPIFHLAHPVHLFI